MVATLLGRRPQFGSRTAATGTQTTDVPNFNRFGQELQALASLEEQSITPASEGGAEVWLLWDGASPLNTVTGDSESFRYNNLLEIMKISLGLYQVWG